MKNNSIKTVVFVSNFFNHHQKPFSDSMYKCIGDGFRFIETQEMTDERKNMGWSIRDYPSYVISKKMFETDKEYYLDLINAADFVIFGSAPQMVIQERIKLGKPIIKYSERPLKKGLEPLKYFPRLIKWHKNNPCRKPIYMLCASAYTAEDYAKFGLFRHKCYKWGYFPATKKYENISAVLDQKESNSLLWVARLIELKHPEYAIEVAKRLKKEEYSFLLNMIGVGPMESYVRNYIDAEGLSDCVHLLGTMKPNEVRQYMEKSELFIFTSDRNEGWGAVLNESMNSACAVVANRAIGAVPFLVNDKDNGLVYHEGDVEELYQKTKWLLDHPTERRAIARRAYETITTEWNEEIAAERLLDLLQDLNDHKTSSRYLKGPCSKA